MMEHQEKQGSQRIEPAPECQVSALVYYVLSDNSRRKAEPRQKGCSLAHDACHQ